MLLLGGLLPVGGPLSRVGNRQRRSQDQHLAHAALGVGCQDRPADARVQRQLREPASELGDDTFTVEGAELAQQLHTVANAAGVRRIQKRKFSMSPRPRAAICRMTAARLVRSISGSV